MIAVLEAEVKTARAQKEAEAEARTREAAAAAEQQQRGDALEVEVRDARIQLNEANGFILQLREQVSELRASQSSAFERVKSLRSRAGV